MQARRLHSKLHCLVMLGLSGYATLTRPTSRKDDPRAVGCQAEFQVEDGNIHRAGESGHASVIVGKTDLDYASIRIRGKDVDHRSLLSPSNSPSKSWSGATGSGVGGFSALGNAGGVNRPLRTASANRASASIGLLVSWGGPISAITRPRSVTRTVSPDAASRTYSLSRLLSTFMSTDLMGSNVATGSYFVKPVARSTRGLVTLSGYATLTRPAQFNLLPPHPGPLPRWGEGVEVFLLKHVLAHGKVTASWSLIP